MWIIFIFLLAAVGVWLAFGRKAAGKTILYSLLFVLLGFVGLIIWVLNAYPSKPYNPSGTNTYQPSQNSAPTYNSVPNIPQQSKVEIPSTLPSATSIDATPSISYISPATIPVNSPTNIQIYGNNFSAGAEVWLGQAGLNVLDVKPGVITAQLFGLMKAGVYQIGVHNPNGKTSNIVTLEVTN